MINLEKKLLLQLINLENIEIENFLNKSFIINQDNSKYYNNLIAEEEFEINKVNKDCNLIYSFSNVKFKFFKILYLFYLSIINSKNYIILYKHKNNYEIIYTKQIARYRIYEENKIKSFLKDIKKYLIFFISISEVIYITCVK
tara:strand:+ start:360 stop:788 length:429 start_codon:yes stop_codon:yes gene_type:complete